MDKVTFACHVDNDEVFYDCVIDDGNHGDCVYAIEGMKKDDCEYWLPVNKEYEKDDKEVDVNELSNIIREIDGNHDLGAGAIAEKLLDRLVMFKRGNS